MNGGMCVQRVLWTNCPRKGLLKGGTFYRQVTVADRGVKRYHLAGYCLNYTVSSLFLLDDDGRKHVYKHTQTNERKSIKQNTRKQIETIKRLKMI